MSFLDHSQTPFHPQGPLLPMLSTVLLYSYKTLCKQKAVGIWWVTKEKGCARAMDLQCRAAWGPWQHTAGKGPGPPPVSQPATARLAQTLEAERHLGFGRDSGFLLANRNP